MVNEVMADLDIQKLTWGLPAEAIESPYRPVREAMTAAAEPESYREISNAAEAAAYMQQVALKLRNWRESLEKTPAGAARDPPVVIAKRLSRMIRFSYPAGRPDVCNSCLVRLPLG